MFASRSRRLILFCTALLAACAASGAAPTIPSPEPPVRRAALAHVTVENRTDERLYIAFVPAGPTGGEIVVGHVGPAATAPVAPVTAGEPIILIGRTRTGAELRLPPRTFEVGQDWVWVIPDDARFDRPGGGGR